MHKLIKVVMIYKNKILVFVIFKVVILSFKNFYNSKTPNCKFYIKYLQKSSLWKKKSILNNRLS